jgi:hypothetical protein
MEIRKKIISYKTIIFNGDICDTDCQGIYIDDYYMPNWYCKIYKKIIKNIDMKRCQQCLDEFGDGK